MDKKEKIELFKEICVDIPLTSTIKEACELHGKPENFYYRVMYDYGDDDEVRKFSTRARECKAHRYFDECQVALKDLKEGKIDSSTARVLTDGFLRLAGKANQGLYGNKVDLSGQLDVKHAIVEFCDECECEDTDEVQTTAN